MCAHIVADNWAMVFAQRLAVKYKMSLHVIYYARRKFLQYNTRHWSFVIASNVFSPF